MNGGWGISYEITLTWMPLGLTNDKSTLVQVMAWCRQATSHYLTQCWPTSPTSMSPNGVTRPQWVNCHWALSRWEVKSTVIKWFELLTLIHHHSTHDKWHKNLKMITISKASWYQPLQGWGEYYSGTRLAQNDKHEYTKNIVLEYYSSTDFPVLVLVCWVLAPALNHWQPGTGRYMRS